MGKGPLEPFEVKVGKLWCDIDSSLAAALVVVPSVAIEDVLWDQCHLMQSVDVDKMLVAVPLTMCYLNSCPSWFIKSTRGG